jgi:coenzyme F420-reducing hydrogenase delta subunit
MPKSKISISASTIKTLNECSWRFWASKFIKLPDKSNDGAMMGSCVHALLECLYAKKRREFVKNIIETQELPKSFSRFYTIKLNQLKIFSDNYLQQCLTSTINAINTDFFMDGWKVQKPEYRFDIEDGFKIKGFIDIHAIKKEGDQKVALIRDFKTSKAKYSPKELDGNWQAMIYLMALKDKYPELDINKSKVEFIFVKFKDGKQVVQVTEEEVNGLREYLKAVQNQVDNFTEKDAISNLAANQPYPEKGGGFCGPMMCGAKNKGELKVDGSPKYTCPYRHSFDYYVLLDKDGEIKSSAFNLEDLEVGDNLVEKRTYSGCPAFNNKNILV